MPFDKLSVDNSIQVLDFLGRCPQLYTLNVVSKQCNWILNRYYKVCSAELRKFLPNIEVLWKDLSELEQSRLQSPLVLKQLRADTCFAKRKETYHRVLKVGTTKLDDPSITVFEHYAIRMGVDPADAWNQKFTPRHLFAISFRPLTFNRIWQLIGKQLDAAIEGFDPVQLFGLNDTQVNGIKLGLSRDQVNYDWFSEWHLKAIEAGFKYDEIQRLHSFQVEGLFLKLTRAQVTMSWFTEKHVEAIKMGFHYEDIKELNAAVTSIDVLTRLEIFVRQWKNRLHVLHFDIDKITENDSREVTPSLSDTGLETKINSERTSINQSVSQNAVGNSNVVSLSLSGGDTALSLGLTPSVLPLYTMHSTTSASNAHLSSSTSVATQPKMV